MTEFAFKSPLWDVDYWTVKLERELDVIRPLRKEAHDNCRDFSVLTTEEQYRLVDALMQMDAYVSLLREDLDQYANNPTRFKKRSFWKKLFRK